MYVCEVYIYIYNILYMYLYIIMYVYVCVMCISFVLKNLPSRYCTHNLLILTTTTKASRLKITEFKHAASL